MTIADWRLSYDAMPDHPGADFAFGSVESGYVFTKMPVLDGADLRDDDTDNPRGDGMSFGQDFRGGRPITFEIEALAEAADLEGAEALVTAMIDEFMDVWDGDAVAKFPGAVAALTSHTGRTTFGRPRSPVADTTRTFQGRATMSGEFQSLDNLWYGAEQVETVTLVPPDTSMIVFPVVFPLVFGAPPASRSTLITVEGAARARTRPVITIYGPIVNPVVELGSLRFAFDTQLAYDETITIDTRAWRRTILRNGTGNIATTGTSSRLLDAGLTPGKYEFVLRGTAPTGKPRATVAWRNPHKHW
jgi:hypothetical protein